MRRQQALCGIAATALRAVAPAGVQRRGDVARGVRSLVSCAGVDGWLQDEHKGQAEQHQGSDPACPCPLDGREWLILEGHVAGHEKTRERFGGHQA
jgi:hypothetical protein